MTPEHAIQNDFIRTFGTLSTLRIWRANTGVGFYADHRTRTARRVQFGVTGQADLTGLLANGRRLEIEVKSPTGRQSQEQKDYQAMIERFGGLYILARSVGDVQAALTDAGVNL